MTTAPTALSVPTTATPALAVDLYTWGRDFHGIRPRGTDDERPRVNHAVARVASAISWHINGKTREATLSTRRIAEAAQVSSGTVSKAIETLERLGWLQVIRSKKPGTDYDAAHTYRLTSPVAAIRAAREVTESAQVTRYASVSEAYMPQSVRHDASLSEAELRSLTTSLTTRDEKTSPNAAASARESASLDRKRRIGDRTAEQLPLHTDWTPDNANRALAANLGLNLDTEAAAFRIAVAGHTSTQWGAVFSEYLKSAAAGTVTDMFRWGLDAENARARIAAQAVAGSAGYPSQPLSATETDETDESVPEAAPTVENAPTGDLEPVDAEVVEIAPAAGPGPAGYSPEIEAAIRRTEKFTGHLSGPERVAVAELLAQGHPAHVVSGEITIMRERARYAS